MTSSLKYFVFFVLFLTVHNVYAQTVVFEENFEEKLKDGWSWIREVPGKWKIHEKGLEIQMLPQADKEAKNILIRDVPDRNEGTLIFETKLSNKQTPKVQFQQAGLFLMQGDNLVFKFVKEMIDGEIFVFPGKIPLKTNVVHLRLIVNGENVTAEFKPEGEEKYRCAFEGKIPPINKEKERISLQCWHGPENEEHWVRFENFRIMKK